ncbi:MAG: iron-containing alcohol dehydrogenase [Nitrososphaerota archaeon]|jgi:alcohol dehydrogenase class IV|nr:iron-containing alcohol dehydrogenase [Nitrososphaerota archaeon]MDG6937249.1 iron-containing alcohol dehydrogenase [Nitrososphaerota archaeon]MDG6961956.1 iron-containing alcohol dehydrogenase [Nitrososphaerota archaeon]MDG6962791.1 iron-containing alcohol dehydrogenase [Nitrososphaerota archaeon]MDG6970100.1 iron-containing alcohol dehydrogenase [Nitrososphaerota archaeon]
MSFSYYLPTKIVFGFGALQSLRDEAGQLNATKALLVTDKVMVKTGVVEKVTKAMGDAAVDVFDEVEAEPRIEVAQSVGEQVRRGSYGLVVGVGGGSSMDMAKVAAGLATNPGPARAFVGNNLLSKPPLSSIMVPTTAGTGAELTVTSMVTLDGHKRWINSPLLLPKAAIVDPELTMTMPRGVTAATGLDALCHNAEAYISTLASPITDSIALEGVRLVSSNLERAFDDGTDRKARESMSLGALLGGISLQAKMVYGHSIGYTIATRFRLPHGVSCGIPLPYIISGCAATCAPKMSRLADAFGVGVEGQEAAELGGAIGKRVIELLKHLGVPTSMKELGVKEEDLPVLARECLDMYPRPNSPLAFDQRSMEGLYRTMWEGQLPA